MLLEAYLKSWRCSFQTVSFQPVLRGVETDIPGSVSRSPCCFLFCSCYHVPVNAMLKTWDHLQKGGKEPFSGLKTAESQCVGDGEMESCGRVVLLLRLSVYASKS